MSTIKMGNLKISGLYQCPYPDCDVIILQFCKDVTIEGNWEKYTDIQRISLYYCLTIACEFT